MATLQNTGKQEYYKVSNLISPTAESLALIKASTELNNVHYNHNSSLALPVTIPIHTSNTTSSPSISNHSTAKVKALPVPN